MSKNALLAYYECIKAYKGQVLVFDDCDTLFYDDVSLNILKAALDTDHKRTISWMAESRILEEEGVPRQFDFCGSVIFISNLDFDRVRSVRIKPHLDALKSRSLYYDLEIGTVEDKIRRIKSLVSTGLFEKNRLELNDEMKQEIVDFLNVYMHDLDEVSIRTALKIGGLARRNPNAWKKSAVYSLMRREAKFRFLLEEKKANNDPVIPTIAKRFSLETKLSVVTLNLKALIISFEFSPARTIINITRPVYTNHAEKFRINLIKFCPCLNK